jgi:hypothetical protein
VPGCTSAAESATRRLAGLCFVLLLVLFGTQGCAKSSPTLPPDSPTKVHTLLAGASADDFLTQITTYAWNDDGAAAGARFSWISRDAAAKDASAAARAEQSADVLAEFLLNHHDELVSIRSGFLGLSKRTAAQENPILIRSYARALAPYLGRLVGHNGSAFESVQTAIASDPSALRDLLSVVVPDTEAGQTIARAANASAGSFEDAAVAAWSAGKDTTGDLTSAGTLLGSVAGAVQQAGSRDVRVPTTGETLNQLTVRIATTVVRTDPNPTAIQEYVQNGQLMDAAAVERALSADVLRSFFLTLRGYLNEKGFAESLNAFQDAYTAAASVPAEK